jgi:hypothetical protein
MKVENSLSHVFWLPTFFLSFEEKSIDTKQSKKTYSRSCFQNEYIKILVSLKLDQTKWVEFLYGLYLCGWRCIDGSWLRSSAEVMNHEGGLVMSEYVGFGRCMQRKHDTRWPRGTESFAKGYTSICVTVALKTGRRYACRRSSTTTWKE